MPKKKRPKKRSYERRAQAARTVSRPEAQPPTVNLVAAAADLVERDGTGTDAEWQQLRETFLAKYPVCPDCQCPWDLDTADEQAAPLDGEIALIVFCPAYEADLDAGVVPPRHPTGDGIIRVTLTLI